MSSIITFDNYIKTNKNEIQKMIFINNAINDGWTVKKYENSYIFEVRMALTLVTNIFL